MSDGHKTVPTYSYFGFETDILSGQSIHFCRRLVISGLQQLSLTLQCLQLSTFLLKPINRSILTWQLRMTSAAQRRLLCTCYSTHSTYRTDIHYRVQLHQMRQVVFKLQEMFLSKKMQLSLKVKGQTQILPESNPFNTSSQNQIEAKSHTFLTLAFS